MVYNSFAKPMKVIQAILRWRRTNMNKNWLYRVLALVLIAMLALPVALAEEVEEVEAVLGADGATEDLYLGNDGADVDNFFEPSSPTIDPDDDIGWGYDDKVITPDAFQGDEAEAIGLYFDGNTGSYDDLVNVSYKSSKTSVANVTGEYKEGNIAYAAIAMYKPGKATITIKAKFGKMSGSHYKTKSKTIKVKLTIKSALEPASVKTYFGKLDEYDGSDAKKSGHPYGKVDMGYSGKILMPIPFDEDGNNTSYSLELADPAYHLVDEDGIVWPSWSWKWSNSKVAFFKETGVSVSKEKQQSGTWYEDYEIDGDFYLEPVFYKPGNVTVTFTALNGKKKATAKFTVKKNEKKWTVNKKTAKVKGDMAVVVKQIKYTDLEHAEVTIVCINDSGATWKKGPVAFGVYREGYVDDEGYWLEGIFSIKDDIKNGQTKTYTLKFDHTKNDAFMMDDEGLYPKMPDLSKNKWKVDFMGWEIKDEDYGHAVGNEEA